MSYLIYNHMSSHNHWPPAEMMNLYSFRVIKRNWSIIAWTTDKCFLFSFSFSLGKVADFKKDGITEFFFF